MSQVSEHRYNLSVSDLNKLIEKYEARARNIDKIATDSINETLAFGKEYVTKRADEVKLPDEREAYKESYVVPAHYSDGVITGELRTDNVKATYAENGTGVVGSRRPNTAIQGWVYDVNQHGEKGWNYMGSDGQFHHTKGIPAQKIYYEASIEMQRVLKEKIVEKLKGE